MKFIFISTIILISSCGKLSKNVEEKMLSPNNVDQKVSAIGFHQCIKKYCNENQLKELQQTLNGFDAKKEMAAAIVLFNKKDHQICIR